MSAARSSAAGARSMRVWSRRPGARSGAATSAADVHVPHTTTAAVIPSELPSTCCRLRCFLSLSLYLSLEQVIAAFLGLKDNAQIEAEGVHMTHLLCELA